MWRKDLTGTRSRYTLLSLVGGSGPTRSSVSSVHVSFWSCRLLSARLLSSVSCRKQKKDVMKYGWRSAEQHESFGAQGEINKNKYSLIKVQKKIRYVNLILFLQGEEE